MLVDPARFLPHLTDLRFDQIEVTPHLITLTIVAVRPEACCPLCHQPSATVHSYYTRTVADLPWGGIRATLCVRTRRFACPVDACERKVFCERLTEFVPVYGRRTHNARTFLERIGLALAGRAGARLAHAQGMPVSRMTLLRLVRALPCPTDVAPIVVGVDDFARRRGRTYAGIVVDLERHRPLDLLPDASADTWAAWLAAHPRVTVVSRDRGQPFVEGTARGAPAATAVADRWHLLANAGDALERLFTREHAALRAVTPGILETAAEATPQANAAAQGKSTSAEPRATHQARYEEARRRHAEGYSITAVARMLHLHRDTVRAYLTADTPPRARGHPPRRRPVIDAYVPYLRRRWAEGCRSATDLFHEIQARGYRGSYATCAHLIATLLRPAAASTRAPSPAAKPVTSPRQAARLFLARPDALTVAQQATLTRLRTASVRLAAAHDLAQSFATMVREREGERLDAWVQDASTSGIAELRGFADGLLADKAAVQAGLTLPWSQGQTEGFVNKVKMLKRQMFGRAKLDLLRQRMLLG